MSEIRGYPEDKVRDLAKVLRDSIQRAGERPAFDKPEGHVGFMDYLVVAADLLDRVAATGGLPACGTPDWGVLNPCVELEIKSEFSPLRGARTMDTAPADGRLLRVYHRDGYWTVAWCRGTYLPADWGLIRLTEATYPQETDTCRIEELLGWKHMTDDSGPPWPPA